MPKLFIRVWFSRVSSRQTVSHQRTAALSLSPGGSQIRGDGISQASGAFSLGRMLQRYCGNAHQSRAKKKHNHNLQQRKTVVPPGSFTYQSLPPQPPTLEDLFHPHLSSQQILQIHTPYYKFPTQNLSKGTLGLSRSAIREVLSHHNTVTFPA